MPAGKGQACQAAREGAAMSSCHPRVSQPGPGSPADHAIPPSTVTWPSTTGEGPLDIVIMRWVCPWRHLCHDHVPAHWSGRPWSWRDHDL